jgi:hypothetical protein
VKEINDADFADNADATAIDDVELKSDADVYTLQGIHVGKATDLNTLPKGIYVIGGRKVMVK